MKKLIEIKSSNTEILRIDYDIGNLCNYKGWYCFPGANEGDVKFPNASVVKKNIVKLINHYVNSGKIKKVRLSLVGGEPSLWKELGEFIKYVSDNTIADIYIITNGSRSLNWWKKYADYFSGISISIHHERVNLDHIESLANILLEKNILFITDVLMDHKEWEKCIGIVNRLTREENKFLVLAKPIQIAGETFFTEEQKEYLKTHLKKLPAPEYIDFYQKRLNDVPTLTATFDDDTVLETTNEHYFILNGLNRFKGWECSLGVYRVFINRQGEVTGTCWQALYGLDYRYNVNDPEFENNFNPEIKPVICEQLMCTCAGETALSKKRIKDTTSVVQWIGQESSKL